MALDLFTWSPSELDAPQLITRYFCLVLETAWLILQGIVIYSIISFNIKFDYELVLNCIILFFDSLFCLTIFIWTIYTEVHGQSKLSCQIQGTIILFTLSMFIFGTSLLSTYRHFKVKQVKKIKDYYFVGIFLPAIILLGSLFTWAATNSWYTTTPSSYCMLNPLEGKTPRILFGMTIVTGILCVVVTLFNYICIMRFSFSFISNYNFEQEFTNQYHNALKPRRISKKMMIFRGCVVIFLYLMTIVPQLLSCLYSVITLKMPPVWLHLYASSSVSVYCGVNLACMLALNPQARKAFKRSILMDIY